MNNFVTEVMERDNLTKNKEENYMNGVEIWVDYWRKNPHRFVMDYLNIKLHIFQQMLIYMIDRNDISAWIASRGLGKSFITALYCCVRCILYPGTKVIISSKTKGQAAGIIIQKINDELMSMSYILSKEIKEINTSQNKPKVTFWCGSTIEVAVQSENSRYLRSHILILDEYVIMDKDILDKVLLPTQVGMRQPGYKSNPKYSHIKEQNKQIYLSSAGFTHEWGYDKFRFAVKKMLTNDGGFACAIPFTCAIHHNITTKEQIKNEMEKDGATPASFLMEYCAVFFNESDTAFFKSNQINPCRIVQDVFIPPTNSEYNEAKKSPKELKKLKMPRLKGEFRVIGADIAISKGNNNDNSVFTLMRLLPEGDKLIRYVVHIEAHNGMEKEQQAIRLKQLFKDFDADYMIIDTSSVGSGVWDHIQRKNYDKDRNEWHEAMTCFNKDNDVNEKLAMNADPVVYSMKARVNENHKVATSLRDGFNTKKVLLPIPEVDARELLINDNSYINIKDLEERAIMEARMLQPYAQTNALVNELITLEWEYVGNERKVRVFEKGRNRKDRYSSLGYANFLADIIEEREYANNNNNVGSDFLFLT